MKGQSLLLSRGLKSLTLKKDDSCGDKMISKYYAEYYEQRRIDEDYDTLLFLGGWLTRSNVFEFLDFLRRNAYDHLSYRVNARRYYARIL